MQRFLERVGVTQQVLDLIPEIVETCRVCRMWSKPGPRNVCSIDIPDRFNEQVKCDLLFVYEHSILHLLCRCTRWHAAVEVQDKRDETLIDALDVIWT